MRENPAGSESEQRRCLELRPAAWLADDPPRWPVTLFVRNLPDGSNFVTTATCLATWRRRASFFQRPDGNGLA